MCEVITVKEGKVDQSELYHGSKLFPVLAGT